MHSAHHVVGYQVIQETKDQDVCIDVASIIYPYLEPELLPDDPRHQLHFHGIVELVIDLRQDGLHLGLGVLVQLQSVGPDS